MPTNSKAWLHEQRTDHYAKRAKSEGYRSRSAYKLSQLDERDHLFRPGMTVVDLGSAPGGWSQVAAQKVGSGGRVIALDMLEMTSLRGVTFLQGDFTDQAVYEQLVAALDGKPVDLVISDMAPNLSGVTHVDRIRGIALAELALEFAQAHLKPGGKLLVKLFQGEGYSEFLQAARRQFDKVVTRKPDASRSRSSETYVVAIGKRAPTTEPAA